MELLYLRDILNINFSSLLTRLSDSKLNDVTVENEIVSIMEDIIEESRYLAQACEIMSLDIRTFSGDVMHLDRRFISTPVVPNITISTLEIDNVDNSEFSGLVSKVNAADIYASHFWKKGDSVIIINKVESTAGLPSTVDSMVTREILENSFLGKNPGEVLNNCNTDGITGSILLSEISPNRVISYGDSMRTYHPNTDVDISIRDIATPFISISGKNSIVSSLKLETNSIYSLVSKGGAIRKKDIGERYLNKTFMVSNEAEVKTSDTNIETVQSVSVKMNSRCAPKTGWHSTNIKRVGTIPVEMESNIVDSVLHSSLLTEPFKPISYSEILSVIDTISEEILQKEVCDDN